MNFTCLAEDEIRAKYRMAKDKADMLQVLAELTASSQKEIAEFLGVDEPSGVKRKYTKPKGSINQERAWELYRQGLNDKEMAEQLGVTRSGVNSWRHKHGLPMIGVNPVAVKGSDEERMALYQQGLEDPEIAKALGTSKSSVFCWRKKHHLPPNGKRGGNRRGKKGKKTNGS